MGGVCWSRVYILNMRNLFRNFFRARTHRMEQDHASKWQTRLSVLYFLIAWNGLALVGYQYYNRHQLGLKIDEETFAEKMARNNPNKNVTVVSLNNFTHVRTEVVSPDKSHADKPASSELLDA